MKTFRQYAETAALALAARVLGKGMYVRNHPTQGTPPPSWPTNWFQRGYRISPSADFEHFAPIAACVSIISQDLSRIPLKHVRVHPRGGIEEIDNRAPARVFLKPNSYQSRVDWLLYKARSLLTDGNAYSYAPRNERGEVKAFFPLHPGMCWPYIAEDSSIYYRVSKDPTSDLSDLDTAEWVPQRDMLHVRLHTPKHPLIGETPLVAAINPTAAGNQINEHNANFFRNMSRPSGLLRHPGKLKETAMERIKERWKQLTTQGEIGEVVVLSEGMEWQGLSLSAVDAELAKSYELSERQIFQIYRVPPFLGGDLGDASLTNVESLTRFYVQSCLSFYETLLEESLRLFFKLPADEQIMFDVEAAILAGDLKERMEALGKAVQNSIYSPDEARYKEKLPPAPNGHGKEPRVQQQLVPLSWGMDPANQPGAALEPAPKPEPEPEPEPASDDVVEESYKMMMGAERRVA